MKETGQAQKQTQLLFWFVFHFKQDHLLVIYSKFLTEFCYSSLVEALLLHEQTMHALVKTSFHFNLNK